MRVQVYDSIDDIDPNQIEPLPTGLDFSYGLLRAMEKSLWGELLVRYITVSNDDADTVVAFTPVYVGSNLNFNALLPKLVQKGYNALVGGLGTAMATRVAVVGSLISDCGGIPMHPDLTDRHGALRLLLGEIDQVAKKYSAQLGMLKDIHSNFPAEERALMREAGFKEGFSLPTIRINTAYGSFEEYLTQHLSKTSTPLPQLLEPTTTGGPMHKNKSKTPSISHTTPHLSR